MRFYLNLSWVVACLSAGAVQAQASEPIDSKGWRYTLTPYAWAASLSGDLSVLGAPKTHVSSTFSSLKKDLDFAAMLVGTARKGRLGVFTDLTYLKASSSASLPSGLPAQSVRVGAKAFTAMLGTGYAIHYTNQGHVDVLAALRYWYVDTKVSVDGGAFNHLHRDDRASWADALVGLRGVHYFSDRVYATGWALAGAGGSKFSWDVAAGVGYKFNPSVSAQLGYRALGVNYTHDRFHYKMIHQGPAAGITWHF